MESVITVVFYYLFFVMSVVMHECAHGYAAMTAGDDTAYMMGRLTLNPIKHIDPLWTIAMPIIMLMSGIGVVIGGAKPVPVNPLRFRNPRRDIFVVSAAGVAVNGLLAVVCVIPLHLEVFEKGTIGMTVFGMAGLTNLFLMVFNLLPVPPLDGSRILANMLPREQAAALERVGVFGFVILIVLLRFGLGRLMLSVVLFVWIGVLRVSPETTNEVWKTWQEALRNLF